MILFRYLNYFFFIAFKWNWEIAWLTIKQEIAGEKKYGIITTGSDDLKKLEESGINIYHSTMYMPVTYHIIEAALDNVQLKQKQTFLDIGCGKGRAMCVAAFKGFQKVTGVDFSIQFCEEAITNLEKTVEKIPALEFEVFNNDAAEFDIADDVNCIFIFNPFDSVIMEMVADNIEESLQLQQRDINIIYANPVYKNLFIERGFEEIYHTKNHQYFEVSIFSLPHKNAAG